MKEALLKLKESLLDDKGEGFEASLRELDLLKEKGHIHEVEEALRLLKECEELILRQMEEVKRRMEELKRHRDRLLRYNEVKALGPGP